MRLMSKMLTVAVMAVALLVIGCGQAAKEVKPAAAAAAPSVADMAKEKGFELVKIDEVKKIVGNGVWDKARGTLVDARPFRKYEAAHIPTAQVIPDTEFDKYFPEFEKLGLAKDAYIVTYCGGVKCEKSLIVAEKLRENGYTNIKMYLDGEPDWTKSGAYMEVSLDAAKKIYDKGGATFIDARPDRMFKKGTIAGSVNVPDTAIEKFAGNLPADKAALAVTFCGGFKCEKSHIVADYMLKNGYTNVLVLAAGEPAWKAAGYPYAAGGEKVETAAPAAAVSGDFPVEEQGVIKTSFFIEKLLNPATRPADVTIVDVRNANEVAAGIIPGTVNVSSKETAKGCDAFVAQMPKTGKVVFHCASGGRAGETYYFLLDTCKLADISRYYFLDAAVNCDSQPCKIGN